MATLSLLKREHPLAPATAQRATLAALPLARSFEDALRSHGLHPLKPTRVEILQLNVGKRCNQTCRHCHVDAGPDRKEVMPDDVVDACLRVLQRDEIPTLDITGGAPELHPRFRDIIRQAANGRRRVIHRCNLTAVTLPNYQDIPELLAERHVEIAASLPYWQSAQTNAQRGDGVFEDSLRALQRLNELGYGVEGSGRVLTLVTNPVGAFLPGNQASLEREWKAELKKRHGILFNRLFTITNMPISRFLEFLVEKNNLQGYMDKLVAAYNPAAAEGVMCRNTLSVGWDGRLYDCDFNQMLELPVAAGAPQTIHDYERAALESRAIVVGPHCFGCTAGAGSSCGGATSG
ncbi:MAG: arsenosugar biosynthesis radical SAM (seleno)protein ArsS [Myxococcota bacterium]